MRAVVSLGCNHRDLAASGQNQESGTISSPSLVTTYSPRVHVINGHMVRGHPKLICQCLSRITSEQIRTQAMQFHAHMQVCWIQTIGEPIDELNDGIDLRDHRTLQVCHVLNWNRRHCLQVRAKLHQ